MPRETAAEALSAQEDGVQAGIHSRQTRSVQDSNAILSQMTTEAETGTQIKQSLASAKNQADHQNVAQNAAQIQNIIQQFQELGAKLYNKFEDVIEDFIEACPLPDLWEKFKGLSPLMQSLICIGIFALVAITAYASWHFIHWLWPHLIEFASKHKESLLAGAHKSIQVLSQTPILKSISASLENSSSTGNEEIDKSEMGIGNMLITSGSIVIVNFLTQFFAHMSSQA